MILEPDARYIVVMTRKVQCRGLEQLIRSDCRSVVAGV